MRNDENKPLYHYDIQNACTRVVKIFQGIIPNLILK